MAYVQAITKAVALAGTVGEGVKYLIDHADDIRRGMDKARGMLQSAKKLVETAETVVDIDSIREAVAREDADGGAPASEADLAPAPRRRPNPLKKVREAADAVASFRDERVSDVNRWKLERAALKAVHDAKRTVLEHANIRVPLTKLVEQLNSEDDAVRIANMGILDAPGCFAIATYGKLDRVTDPTDYRGVFVGRATCVGDGIAAAIVPTGNADVYADIKYRQNVWVYVFSCVEEMLAEKHEALASLLEANESYGVAAYRSEAEGGVDAEAPAQARPQVVIEVGGSPDLGHAETSSD